MIRARNLADAQVQVFVGNYELLLLDLKHSHCSLARYILLEKPDVFSLCLVAVLYNDGIHQIILIIILWYFVFTVKTTIYRIQ
jgi:hypothetical protein